MIPTAARVCGTSYVYSFLSFLLAPALEIFSMPPNGRAEGKPRVSWSNFCGEVDRLIVTRVVHSWAHDSEGAGIVSYGSFPLLPPISFPPLSPPVTPLIPLLHALASQTPTLYLFLLLCVNPLLFQCPCNVYPRLPVSLHVCPNP